MGPPYIGQCVCGQAEYRVTEAPLTIYACHCTDCQKRSGSAFGISMWVHRTALEITKGEATLVTAPAPDGRPRNYRICGRCATRLWGESKNRDIFIVRAGTLTDTSWLRPVAHLWTRSAQRWFVFPEDVVRFETQPEDLRELVALWRKSREHVGLKDAT
jgi:hypothetical protein